MKGVRRVAELIGDHIGYPAHLAGAPTVYLDQRARAPPLCPRRLSCQRFVSCASKLSYIR